MTVEPDLLAEQALANLVNQFARPLDFLRELAQNAIDAGTARIEVSVAYDPPRPGASEGVVRISVDDWGEGMDEEIIDNQLTRLFSSTKEDDLTKIGKFGIGFTSIFAIGPQAVLLRTGRHGEYWELLFHEDRSFEKRRVDEPVDGTRITLYKRMAEAEVPRFIHDCRFVLDYWCEHSDIPITFRDRTGPEPVADAASDDPFAAFEVAPDPSALSQVSRPLDLPDAPLWVRHDEPGIEVIAGYGDPTRYGFYNGGLTLLNTTSADALGPYEARLGHVSFKVKHDRLEHTLTRDNVLQDDNYTRAMQAVGKARERMREALLDRIEAVATGVIGPDHVDLATMHGWLAAECRVDAEPLRRDLDRRTLFQDHLGRPLRLAKIRAQERQVGSVLMGSGRTPLHDALDEIDVVLVADAPQTRALLEACERPPLLVYFWNRRELERADQVFVMPSPVPLAALTAAERRLVEATSELLRAAVGLRLRVPRTETVLSFTPSEGSFTNRLTLQLGDFAGPEYGRKAALALNGPRDGRVFQRSSERIIRLPAFLHWRTLLVNRHHPLFRAQLLASGEDLPLAAFGLAQALLHTEGREGERAFRRMLDHFAERLEVR